MFGEDAYPTAHLEAAALLHSLVKDLALVDGNKRLAWLATFVLLEINGQSLVVGAAVDFVHAVADGSLDDVTKIADPLAAWA